MNAASFVPYLVPLLLITVLVLTCVLVSRPALPKTSTYDSAVATVVKGVLGNASSPTLSSYVYGVVAHPTCNICGPQNYCFVFQAVFEALIAMFVELSFSYTGTDLQNAWLEAVPLILTQFSELFGTELGPHTAIMEFTANRTTHSNVTSNYAGFGTELLLYSAILACAQAGGEGSAAQCSGSALYKPTCLCIT